MRLRISTRIVNEVPGANRVVYVVNSSPPPAGPSSERSRPSHGNQSLRPNYRSRSANHPSDRRLLLNRVSCAPVDQTRHSRTAQRRRKREPLHRNRPKRHHCLSAGPSRSPPEPGQPLDTSSTRLRCSDADFSQLRLAAAIGLDVACSRQESAIPDKPCQTSSSSLVSSPHPPL